MLFADHDIAIGAMIDGMVCLRSAQFNFARYCRGHIQRLVVILELTSSGIAKLGDYRPRRSRVDTHSGIDLGIAILEHADPRGSYDRLNTANEIPCN